MNRREALKKLAVGGAIAAGGSIVLSSNAVAATSSGLPAGVAGAPGEGENLQVVFQPAPDGNNNGKRIVLGSAQPLANGSGGVLTVWYTWTILSANLKAVGNKVPTLQLRNASNPGGLPIAQGVGSAATSSNYPTVSVSRSDGGVMKKDSYRIALDIQAQCAGSSQSLYLRYEFEIVGADTITQQQTMWKVM